LPVVAGDQANNVVEIQGDALDFVFGLTDADFYVRTIPRFIRGQSPPSFLGSAFLQIPTDGRRGRRLAAVVGGIL
jgi:hypothetical protein